MANNSAVLPLLFELIILKLPKIVKMFLYTIEVASFCAKNCPFHAYELSLITDGEKSMKNWQPISLEIIDFMFSLHLKPLQSMI